MIFSLFLGEGEVNECGMGNENRGYTQINCAQKHFNLSYFDFETALMRRKNALPYFILLLK